MSIENKLKNETDEEQKIRIDKFSRKYDPEYAKNNLDIAPCAIWGYIQDLEKRVESLENKINEKVKE